MTDQSTLDIFGGQDTSPVDSGQQSPLADRMRPVTLEELVGQQEILAPGSFLREAIEHDQIPSLILWGPPGCGKTTIGQVIKARTRAVCESFSAVLGGVAQLRALVEQARIRQLSGVGTILFVDEIHHFNKSQQDAFLPHIERGTITLVGATTENPSFSLNNALLSRCRVIRLEPLAPEEIRLLLDRALGDPERGLGRLELQADEELLRVIAEMGDGDARRSLNLIEQVAHLARTEGKQRIDLELLRQVLQQAPLQYDRLGDAHYNLISAFIKSMRGSSPDAALYYAARMIHSGEDPLFLLRRILIFASEDVGNADPRALQVALAAIQAFERLGMPEGRLAMAQAITYCATAPKSNASYLAWEEAARDAQQAGNLDVPLHLCNAPTRLMKELGYSKGYRYPHDFAEHFVKESYLPDKLRKRRYYRPTTQGYERYIAERLARWWGEGSGSADQNQTSTPSPKRSKLPE
ncbi:MAG: replication-associated recombination protein A [Bradymonadales bacterium]|nr:replication-associated recombination protein A [Bradymonadales bacterium]